MLGRDGHFRHEGQPIRHERLRRVLERGVRYLDEEAAWVVQLGHFRGQIEIEDAPFFVETYDAKTAVIALSDRTEERLAPETLEVRTDDVLYCRVKGRFDARFTRTAQAMLLDAIEFLDDRPALRVGAARFQLPKL